MGWLKDLIVGKPKVMPVSVNDDNFHQEVLRAEVPVVLAVWGPGCAPCQRLEPIMMDLAARYTGRVKVAELNAQAAPKTAAKLGVRGTPTVIYYHARGREAERTVGFKGSLYHSEVVEQVLLPRTETAAGA